MHNELGIQISGFIDFHNGELYNVIGEGNHTETNERLVFYLNEDSLLIAQPKDEFNRFAIEDLTTVEQIPSNNFYSFIDLNISDTSSRCFIIGECKHSSSEEDLILFVDSSSQLFAQPTNMFYRCLNDSTLFLQE